MQTTPVSSRIDACRRAVAALPPGPYQIHTTRHLVHVVDGRGELFATIDTRIPLNAQLRMAGAVVLLPELLELLVTGLALLDGPAHAAAKSGARLAILQNKLAAKVAALAPRPDEARTCVNIRKVGPAFATAEGAQ